MKNQKRNQLAASHPTPPPWACALPDHPHPTSWLKVVRNQGSGLGGKKIRKIIEEVKIGMRKKKETTRRRTGRKSLNKIDAKKEIYSIIENIALRLQVLWLDFFPPVLRLEVTVRTPAEFAVSDTPKYSTMAKRTPAHRDRRRSSGKTAPDGAVTPSCDFHVAYKGGLLPPETTSLKFNNKGGAL
ncbi:MAG: hypothetical protein B7Y39_01850 [Bdellovibrio sp. 28-41-41]|nr:MAG: hypothetical protein B7Y39_01850 [Bdellovibrio sp. 28-41-41]